MTVTSRRAALSGATAVLLAGVAAAPAVAVSPDARLIGLCDELCRLRGDFVRLGERLGACETCAEEDGQMPALDLLYARQDQLMRQIEAAGAPRTTAGALAMVRAALASHGHREHDDVVIAFDDAHWLLLSAAEALVH